MTEITQADRDAAVQYDVVEAFARHRKYGYDQGYYDGRQLDGAEERAAIIAWLEKESTLCDCAAIYDGECVCGALDECKTVPIERILLAIEAGKHLK